MSSETGRRDAPWALTAIVLVLGLLLIWQFTRWTVWTVEIQSETSGFLKWYVDSGDGFSEREGAYAPVPAGEWAEVAVRLPTGVPQSLRLDPIDSTGAVMIKRISWNEPFPGGSGELEVQDAHWEGVSYAGFAEGELWRVEPAPGVPDIFGVWKQGGGWSATVWWAIRGGLALVLAGCVFFAGRAWNRRVLAGGDGG